MASKRDRQRKLERARVERRIARQAHRTRRKRQIQAGVGASLALVLIVVGLTWLLGGFEPDPPPTVARGTCTWNLKDPSADGAIKDTGHPPTSGERRTGTETLTMRTNLGEIQATLDLSRAPCTAASFRYLSEQNYYDNSRCHRLNTVSKFLQCGDTTGNGDGSPSYSFPDEDIPVDPIATPSPSASPGPSPSPGPSATYYAKGTIVMANTGANTNAGQFYIIYGDGSDLGPAYSIVGTVTKGLGFIEAVAKTGARDPVGEATSDGTPNTEVMIQELTVGTPPASSPSPTGPASPSPSPAT